MDLSKEFPLRRFPIVPRTAPLKLAKEVNDFKLQLNGETEAKTTLSTIPFPPEEGLYDVELTETDEDLSEKIVFPDICLTRKPVVKRQ